MSLQIQSQAGAVLLKFGDTLDISEVSEVHRQLADAIDSPNIQVDLSDTEQVDTAGLQLLVSLAKYCAATQRSFALTGCSEPALLNIRRLNLSRLFACDQDGAT